MAGMIWAKKGLLTSERIKPIAGAGIGLRDAGSLRGKKAGCIDRSKLIKFLMELAKKGGITRSIYRTAQLFFPRFGICSRKAHQAIRPTGSKVGVGNRDAGGRRFGCGAEAGPSGLPKPSNSKIAREPISSIDGRRRSFFSFGWPASTTESVPPLSRVRRAPRFGPPAVGWESS